MMNNMSMSSSTKKIVLIGNLSRDIGFKHTIEVAKLLCDAGFSVFTPNQEIPNAVIASGEELYKNAHAMVVLGGDGSILSAAHNASEYDIPILAVNLGRLGYIAQLEKNDIPDIPKILLSDFETEDRSMLSITLKRNGKTVFENRRVLNDAVICKSSGHGVIELKMLCNNKDVINFRGDGIIASTATGSTAYAMSAGGAIIDSALDIIEMTPICAHSLKARPIVFSKKCKVTVECTEARHEIAISLDGNDTTPLHTNDRVEISLSDKVTKLISLPNAFCNILYNKMSEI